MENIKAGRGCLNKDCWEIISKVNVRSIVYSAGISSLLMPPPQLESKLESPKKHNQGNIALTVGLFGDQVFTPPERKKKKLILFTSMISMTPSCCCIRCAFHPFFFSSFTLDCFIISLLQSHKDISEKNGSALDDYFYITVQ